MPTLQMAFKWLREVHNIKVNVFYNNPNYAIEYFVLNTQTGVDESVFIGDAYDIYEQACEAALKYVLENLIINEIAMATIKSYTSVEQSRKLAEILPLESADMKWFFWKSEIDAPKLPTFGYSKDAAENYKSTEAVYLPCWSLSALLELFDDKAGIAKEYETWFAYDNGKLHCGKHFNNPLDAAFELVVWLKENKKI